MIIDKIKKDFEKTNYQMRSYNARKWLMQRIQQVTVGQIRGMRRASTRLTPNKFIGRMYFFAYDPKTKDKLPYYDRFPLVIPIGMYDDGFLGINLHYLEPRARVRLLDQLESTLNNTKYDDTTKMKLSYEIAASLSNAIYPCLKRYLTSHMVSHFIAIDSSEWDIACFLPAQKFVGAPDATIWKDSKSKIRGYS